MVEEGSAMVEEGKKEGERPGTLRVKKQTGHLATLSSGCGDTRDTSRAGRKSRRNHHGAGGRKKVGWLKRVSSL